MQDPEFSRIAAEYKKAGGLWDTEKTFVMHELGQALRDSAMAANSKAIETTVGEVPWVADAASVARRRYIANNAEAKLNAKATRQPKHPNAEQRRCKTKELTAATIQKHREEAKAKADKNAKAKEEHEVALLQEGAVEYLRLELGRNNSLLHQPCW